jgi:hypothetical protein
MACAFSLACQFEVAADDKNVIEAIKIVNEVRSQNLIFFVLYELNNYYKPVFVSQEKQLKNSTEVLFYNHFCRI